MSGVRAWSSIVVEGFIEEESSENTLRGWERAGKEVPPQEEGGELVQPCEKGRCGQDTEAGAAHTFHSWHQHMDLALQSSGFLR